MQNLGAAKERFVVENDDVQWEQNFQRIEHLEPLFRHLPASRDCVSRCIRKGLCWTFCVGKECVSCSFHEMASTGMGPSQKHPFAHWKGVRSLSVPSRPWPAPWDVSQREKFPIMANDALMTGSGAVGDKKPDVWWHLPGQDAGSASVVVGIGAGQSHPSMCRRAFDLCADHKYWVDLQYVILVNRAGRCLYVEVWKRVPPHHTDDIAVLNSKIEIPEVDNLALEGTMAFVGAAHTTGQDPF